MRYPRTFVGTFAVFALLLAFACDTSRCEGINNSSSNNNGTEIRQQQQQQQHTPPTRGHTGHLPKSRVELRRERQQKQKQRHLEALRAQKEEEREAEIQRAAKERQRQWREERRRKYEARQEFLRKQQEAQDRAEEEQRKAQEAELAKQRAQQEALERQRQKAAQEKAAKQQEADEEEKQREGAIVGGRIDCFGIPGGNARPDACGVCGGDDSSCADCAGVPHGNSTEDCAGVCGGTDMSCVDCAGVMNGLASLDVCGICNGDGQSCRDCRGVVNGTAQRDVCGVCEGDGSTCVDCHGVANGPGKLDPCGVCDGDGTSCCSPVKFDGADTTSTQQPVLCSDHGLCSSQHHTCLCDLGWTGPYCSIEQDLCRQVIRSEFGHYDDQASRDFCNDRGRCDPRSGTCRCDHPQAWYGTRCEMSWCNYRGSYNAEWGQCECWHGYGGQFCERCAASRPKTGKRHVCKEVLGSNQPVPQDLRLEKSILLGEEDPRAPVFMLVDADEKLAESYVNGRSYFNLAHRKRNRHGVTKDAPKLKSDVIWPNSTHEGSGYYYDCGCRLATPPKPVVSTIFVDHDDDNTKARREAPPVNQTLAYAAIHLVGRPYRPTFPFVGKHAQIHGGPKHRRQQAQMRMKRQAALERALHERAPINLNECRALLQEVLDEFGFMINAATAEQSELAAAIGDIHDTCGSEASFGFAWFLIAMGVAVFVFFVTVGCIWTSNRYIRFTGPFEEIIPAESQFPVERDFVPGGSKLD